MGPKRPRSLVYINIKIILVIIFSPYFILLISKKLVIFTSDRVIHSFNVLLSAWREVANSFSTEFFSSTCLLNSGVHSGKLIISAPIDHNHKYPRYKNSLIVFLSMELCIKDFANQQSLCCVCFCTIKELYLKVKFTKFEDNESIKDDYHYIFFPSKISF